jgi:hypothetical protein
MSEEVEQESTGKSFKGIIITLVSTVTLGVGGFITNKLTGGKEEEKAATQQVAPIININNTQQQSNSGGKTIIIKEKEAVKPAAPVKKIEGDEFKKEEPKW